ncbi:MULTISPECIES: hypothetical protein [Actinosynnema]|uniref:hypothetical protein n=1 Tax=Actinosynnema TaxID=40566 RepID=UPI0020A39CA6|nr:hypothetical protein [Actinosynnema pretiosum]
MRTDQVRDAAYCLHTPSGVVVTWAGETSTTGWYASLEAVDALHGQAGATQARTGRHHLTDIAGTGEAAPRLGQARLLLRRGLPALRAATAAATTVLAAGTAEMFALRRAEDVSGLSGTGQVAVGILLPEGRVLLTWRSPLPTLVAYDGAEAVDVLHGHNGRTRRVPLDLDGLESAVGLLSERLAPASATVVDALPLLDDAVTDVRASHVSQQ